MLPEPRSIAIPLQEDERGGIRVSGTRVTLDSLIHYYEQGETPEDLHEGFPTIPLSDIYAVIAYYLAHREVVDAYLHRREAEAQRILAEIDAAQTSEQRTRADNLRERIETRRRALS